MSDKICLTVEKWVRKENSNYEPWQCCQSSSVCRKCEDKVTHEGMFMNILLFDWSSVCLSRNHLPTCCAGFELCPSVMITYENISRQRRLITISRTPADHTLFEESVFVAWLYVAWASCYQFMDHNYAQRRSVPHKHIRTCWRWSECNPCSTFQVSFTKLKYFTFPQQSCVMVPWLHFTENEWHTTCPQDHYSCDVRLPFEAPLMKRE